MEAFVFGPPRDHLFQVCIASAISRGPSAAMPVPGVWVWCYHVAFYRPKKGFVHRVITPKHFTKIEGR